MGDVGVVEQRPATANPLAQVFESTFEDLKTIITCNICVRPMYEPYTIHCGHTFCYSCLVAWFEKNVREETCPECRAEVKKRPAPSFVIREMTRLFFSKPELLPHGETSEDYDSIREQERAIVEAHKGGRGEDGLFPGNFIRRRRRREVLLDYEDGVERCPRCSWELESGYCMQCNTHYGTDSEGSSASGSSGYGHHHLVDSEGWPETDDFDDLDSDEEGFSGFDGPIEGRPDLSHDIFGTLIGVDMFSDDEGSGDSDTDDDDGDEDNDEDEDEDNDDDDEGTSMDGFIENDEASDDSHDDEGSPVSQRQNSPELGQSTGGSHSHYGNVHHGDIAHYGDDDDSGDSDSLEDFYSRSPRGISDSRATENHVTDEGLNHEDGSEGQSSSDEDTLQNDNNDDETPSSDSEASLPPNLPTTREPDNRRKRRRVVESDSEEDGNEDEDDDIVPPRPRSRRRLTPDTTSHASHQNGAGHDFQTSRDIPSLGEDNSRRRVIARQPCRNSNVHRESRAPLHNSSRRHNQRPPGITSHSGSFLSPPSHTRAFGENQIAVVPPTSLPESGDNYQRYNDFVLGWSMQVPSNDSATYSRYFDSFHH